MSDNIDNIENQQDEDKERKRPVLFIPLIILACLLLAGVSYAVASGIASPEPTQEPTEEIQPTEEATELVTEEPTVSIEVPTEQPTEEVTEQPTEQPQPTEEAETPTPTKEPIPTREPRPQPTVEPTVELTVEVTQPTVVDSYCGSACDANGNCTGDYACFNGVCWNASICEPPPTKEPKGPDGSCKCNPNTNFVWECTGDANPPVDPTQQASYSQDPDIVSQSGDSYCYDDWDCYCNGDDNKFYCAPSGSENYKSYGDCKGG
jgi:hypothetical protein